MGESAPHTHSVTLAEESKTSRLSRRARGEERRGKKLAKELEDDVSPCASKTWSGWGYALSLRACMLTALFEDVISILV